MKAMPTSGYDIGWDAKWDDMKKYGPMARHIRANIKKLIQPLTFHTVLDVGCGQGSFLAELNAEFANTKIYGTDISTSAIGLATKRVPNGAFSVLDVTTGYLEGKFDLVICSEVLEHIPDDVAALKNIAQMTGKYLVISTVQGRMRKLEPEAWGHVRNYARGELVEKVEQSGLRVIKVVEWGFPFYSPLYRDFINLINAHGTTGSYGLPQKVLAIILYNVFRLNSSRRGDEIFVLAEQASRSV
ncbi:MAG: methyltransferase [Chloroflexi bacterium]|nr:MAG: methyltransferase [Chloroflexota bacterium]